MAARIRAHDWAATPLGPVAAWSDRLKLMVEQVLASPLVSSLVCGPERVLIYNDAAGRLYGARHPGALGRPVPETFPDTWPAVAPLYARVFAGESVQVAAQPLDVGGRGDRHAAVFDAYLVPVREPDGRVACAHMTGFEVGDRLRAEAVLRASEERQTFLLTLSDTLRPLADAVAIQGEACRLLGERLGMDRAYYVEVDEARGVAAVERDYVRDGAPSLVGEHPVASFSWSVAILRRGACHVVADTQDSPVVPQADRAALAALQIIACVGAPLIKGGALVGALCVTASRPRAWDEAEVELLREVGERIWSAVARARTETALRESEERFRTMADNISQLAWTCDRLGDVTWYNRRWLDYTGLSFDAMRDWGWRQVQHPDHVERVAASVTRSRETGEPWQDTFPLRGADGAYRWFLSRAYPIRTEAGEVVRWFGTNTDITDLRGAEARQQVLVNELQHRARNLLGVVAAIADRTVRRGGSVEAFEERLQALSRAQGLLSQGGSDTVEVGALVRAELAAHAERGSDRIHVAGPAVHLTARQVQNFALAAHELTTNAVKHGALKGDFGRVSVTWEIVADRRGRPRLALSWVESGVDVRPDTVTRRGYGTELIQEALAYALQAEVAYALGADGVRCRIELPIS